LQARDETHEGKRWYNSVVHPQSSADSTSLVGKNEKLSGQMDEKVQRKEQERLIPLNLGSGGCSINSIGSELPNSMAESVLGTPFHFSRKKINPASNIAAKEPHVTKAAASVFRNPNCDIKDWEEFLNVEGNYNPKLDVTKQGDPFKMMEIESDLMSALAVDRHEAAENLKTSHHTPSLVSKIDPELYPLSHSSTVARSVLTEDTSASALREDFVSSLSNNIFRPISFTEPSIEDAVGTSNASNKVTSTKKKFFVIQISSF